MSAAAAATKRALPNDDDDDSDDTNKKPKADSTAVVEPSDMLTTPGETDGGENQAADPLVDEIFAAPQIETLLETPTSRLVSYIFPSMPVLLEAVAEVSPLLMEKPPCVVYGNHVRQPRDVAFFSNTVAYYEYSQQKMNALPLTPALEKMLRIINRQWNGNAESNNTGFNAILANRYNTGCDKIGAHSDNETYVAQGVGVVSVSSGQTRKLRIKSKTPNHPAMNGKKKFRDFDMVAGTVMSMQGDFQKEFTHEIPEQKLLTGSRTSFTFRKHGK
jgi:alkylated DNA repair dioxygenase AlkB